MTSCVRDRDADLISASVACTTLASRAESLRIEVFKDNAPADSLLSLLGANDELIRSKCSPSSQMWFLQPRTAALQRKGDHAGVIALMDSVRNRASYEAMGGTLLDRWAHSLYRIGRYQEADTLFAASMDQERTPQQRAQTLVNWGWNRLQLSQHQDALCKFEAALQVLDAACRKGCETQRIAYFREEARRGRREIELIAADGRISPVNPQRCDGYESIDPAVGGPLGTVILFLSVFVARLLWRRLRRRWQGHGARPASAPAKG